MWLLGWFTIATFVASEEIMLNTTVLDDKLYGKYTSNDNYLKNSHSACEIPNVPY